MVHGNSGHLNHHCKFKQSNTRVTIRLHFYLDGRNGLLGQKKLSLQGWKSCVFFSQFNLVLRYDLLALFKVRSKTWQFLQGKHTNEKACGLAGEKTC